MAFEAVRGGSLFLLVQADAASRRGLTQAFGRKDFVAQPESGSQGASDMSGGVIRYTKYSCPRCGCSLSNDEIVMVHASGLCPKCDQPLHIDIDQALPNTGETTLAGIVVFVMYAAAMWGLVTLLPGIGNFFDKLPPFWKIVALFGALVPGAALAKWAESSEVKRLLRAAKELRDEQHDKNSPPGP